MQDPTKIKTTISVWSSLANLFIKNKEGFYVGMVVIGAAVFMLLANGSEGKWQRLYEKERAANAACENEKTIQSAAQNRRYDSLQREYNVFLKGYAPIAQSQLQRTEQLKDSIRNIKSIP